MIIALMLLGILSIAPSGGDDTAALQGAVNTPGISVVQLDCAGVPYHIRAPIIMTHAVTIEGCGHPAGGINGLAGTGTIILHQFNGTLFTFNGAEGLVAGSGGGLRNLRLVNQFGSPGGNGSGVAVLITGVDAGHRASWVRIRDVQIERDDAFDSWGWGILIWGLNSAGVVDIDLSGVSTHTTCQCGGGLGIYGGIAVSVSNSTFWDAAGHVYVTGTSTQRSYDVVLSNVITGALFVLDYATDTVYTGGAIGQRNITPNATGVYLSPGRG